MAETSCDEISTVDYMDHPPLRLLRSEIVPPAPTRSISTIDWLPDFNGHSWLAYGASTLLVISHLPSPLRGEETLTGPVLRQVLEVSADVSSPVTAVSWSPVAPSLGELAAASGNFVCLFSHDPGDLNGSFCWSQNAMLVQATKVEAIGWTGSGDGIIVSGTEIVLWKRMIRSWEIAWKFKGDCLQDLVSSTWSIGGPFATATSWSKLPSACKDAGKCVCVYYSDGKSYLKAKLCHPQQISMIQWRPMSVRQSARNVKISMRNVLLTCCLDGTVRLWSETDDGKSKKGGKDVNDHKTPFCVVAVIEINCVLDGSLGRDVFMVWATQTRGIFKTKEGTNQFFPAEEYEYQKVGKCEWLIGYGPGQLVTLWSIHCLDDISPMRFPRVTLWRRQELQGIDVEPLSLADAAGSPDRLALEKAVIFRKHLYGPPFICALVHLSPHNSLLWSSLHTKHSHDIDGSSPDKSSLSQCMAGRVLDLDGHSGKILQVAFHPIFCETTFAVSLDSSGLLIIWSSFATSHCGLDHPISIPSWKLRGRLQNQDLSLKYTSICWAPSTFKDEQVLLVGHVKGIDCFIVRVCGKGQDNLLCQYMCTIPFAAHSPFENGPASISAIPLPSSCVKTFKLNRFFLLSVWLNDGHFNALSWEVTLHHFGSPASSCECDFHGRNYTESGKLIFEETIAGKRYCIHVSPSSSEFPEPHKHDQVTSFAVVCPSWCTLENDINCKNPAYALATGQADGCLKLWRSNSLEPSTFYIPWELVGMLSVGLNPVIAISLTNCGSKIATLCGENHSVSGHTISIWETVHLIDSGAFILEDKLSVDAEVVAMKWSFVGNDQLLLGVCTREELRVYAQQHCSGQTLLVSDNPPEAQIWQCIALAPSFSGIHDFLWGPKGMAAVVHADYVSLHGQWLSVIDKEQRTDIGPNKFVANLHGWVDGMDGGVASAKFSESDINDLKEVPTGSRRLIPSPSTGFNANGDYQSSSLLSMSGPYGSYDRLEMPSMLEIAEKLRGSLPLYHPQALLAAIYSGNWKRAHAALRQLVENVTSSDEKGFAMKSSHNFPDILLSQYYEGCLSNGPKIKGFQWSGTTGSMTQTVEFQTGLQLTYNMESNASNGRHSLFSTDLEFSGFCEQLEKLRDIGCISSVEKIQILAIVDILSEVSNLHSTSVYASLDEAGRRFWVKFRFKQLYFARRFGRTASMEELAVDSSMIGWAFHSDCRENLFDSLLKTESSWQEMRSLGVGFWYTNVAQLRSRMEKLARQQYLKNKNPKDCAMLYVALNRIQVLTGLFKLSKDDKDKPLVGFLSRNFQEEKNKAAALKNAYVLMGKHQLELAVAFFLLGGDTSSAVNVCVKNLCDEQLALVVCRLVEGQGGPLEYNLMTKHIAPAAVQRGDFWLASLLEWELGRHSRSFLAMVGCLGNSITRGSTVSSNHISFLDPSVGLYCLMLANKNSMKNAVGEQNAATLGRWATLMAATAFSRCGLPLEALECLSTSVSGHVGMDQASVSSSEHSCTPRGILERSVSDSSDWLSSSVASTLHTHARLGLAIQFLCKILPDHPDWPVHIVGADEAAAASINCEIDRNNKLADFQHKLETTLQLFYQRFSLSSSCLVDMILASLCNRGFLSVGYSIAQRHSSSGFLADESHVSDSLLPSAVLSVSVLEATEDISWLLSHFIAVCNMTCLRSTSCDDETEVSRVIKSKGYSTLRFYFQGVLRSVLSLRASIRLCFVSPNEDLLTRLTIVLDLVEYCVQLAIAWVQGNIKHLCQMMQPLIVKFREHSPCEVNMESLKKVYLQEIVAGGLDKSDAGVASQMSEIVRDKEVGYPMFPIPEDERCLVVGACFWKLISNFVKQKLASISVELGDGITDSGSFSKFVAQALNLQDSDSNGEIVSLPEKIMLVLAKRLTTILALVSSHHVKQLAMFLMQKIEKRIRVPTLLWLHECMESQTGAPNQGTLNADIMNKNDDLTVFLMLGDLFVDPHLVHEAFLQEDIDFTSWFYLEPSRDWSDVYRGITEENAQSEPHNQEGHHRNDSSGNETGLPTAHGSPNCSQKDTKIAKENSPFQNPIEVHKRSGELIEALCINPINERQAAISSNRKGIIFLNRGDGRPNDDPSDYIWSDADWPHDGWANSESTPIPTCVSLGVGLGSKKGAHLGLGGATVGVVSLAKPGRAFASGGAHGVPSSAGLGASGLGWETQEDFEQFVDPPPTVETVSTRAFSSHPSMPLFLVGSSNTHIYLWEFGKHRASATYGVLPAANVPPPYALASVSAVRFGPCGHRFASAALDGTVCTWQLEVGGRSNIHPVESSLCFNSHASDVKYISSSGSIVAASGYSSNGANVVVWDTLAPPKTSQAPILCHEGGACSISVFDNDIGSGSISPIIVTGGRNGDVGLHDFRYIATGKAKRHRNFDNREATSGKPSINTQAVGDNKYSDQSLHGMLWYIPKAHLGTVTKISTIPGTSLFLTGGKDGDVKLWDAKAASLVHHWPKLHERHTFLQPSSRGYGGIIRAGVTDIQVCSNGFLSCGGDGTVKFTGLKEHYNLK